MKLWTHHPSNFKLDDSALRIDPTKGDYWNNRDDQFRTRYREVLTRLQCIVGTDQFIWCRTKRDRFGRTSDEIDVVEWELDVPPNQILCSYRVDVWDDIVRSRTDDWNNLIISQTPEEIDDKVGMLIRVPLPPKYVRCLGTLPSRYPRAKSSTV